MTKLPLTGLRIVELGTNEAAAYCGKQFADFGAEVIKIEPPGGDPARAYEPLVDIGNGRRENGHFAWLNTNKQSIIADLANTDDVVRIRALLRTADLLLDGRHPGAVKASLLTHDDLRKSDPGLGITAISWFSDTGPYSAYQPTEAVVRSLAGMVKLIGAVEGPPMLGRDGQAAVFGGLTAFIPSVAALYNRENGARRYRTNIYEALLQVSEFDTGIALELGSSRLRSGINIFGRGYPSGTWETKDGILGVTVATPAQWVGWCQIIGRPELARDMKYSKGIDRFVHAAELRQIFAPILLTRTAVEWFELGIEYRVPLAIVPTMGELLAQPFHRERGSFGTVTIGTAAFEGPVLPQTLLRTPPKPNGPAPLAGQHDLSSVPPRARIAKGAVPPDAALPLTGVRVIDLTMGWAGPSATRQLADLGADVIKVESIQYPDWFRGTDTRPPYHEEQTYEKTYWIQMMNRNKRGITLDLTSEEGRTLLKRLLQTANAVIDNYAADVLPRLGLDAEAMLAINPKLVVVTMPAFGTKGAWTNGRAYGSTLEQASGLPTVQGFEGDPPSMSHIAFGDPIGGLNGATALMLGLMHQRNTGEGQHIDLAQVQCMLPMAAPAIIEQSARGTVGPRLGNRHPHHVPQGCFRALGEDQWITISVRDDEDWQALCRAMRRPDLAADPQLKTAHDRRQHEDMIEAEIEKWTSIVRPDSAMVKLQAAGVPAGIAKLPMDLAADPHLWAVGHWQPVDKAFVGPHLLPLNAYREESAERPPLARSLAPTLGRDNHEVLREVLGLTEAELTALEENDVIGTLALPPRPKPAKKAAQDAAE
ncbi:L-carnitine dehydratase [Afipia sp. P52-10]|uniref:CaiB/BaiF CoA transferase family protein n=1 Tax=Afipia sp. P52-10 TaxID=1429916 RepID=UPI0003DF3C2C|nr:CoA transferase [Afipia sp. P52-10]ETR74818.1 L-carnitine dehydratase [Afipia sp. P52-10]